MTRHTSGCGRPRAPIGLERARLAISMGKWATARALLDELLCVRPDDPEPLSLYGWCLARSGGDLAVAREACQRAVDAQPYVARHLARLAEVYAALGLRRRAEACERDAAHLDPAPVGPEAAADAPRPRTRLGAWLRRARRRAARPLLT